MISTQEAATLVYAAAFGVASACLIVTLAVLFYVWRRFDDRLTLKTTEFERRIGEMEREHRLKVADFERCIRELEDEKKSFQREVTVLKDMLIAYYPNLGAHIQAGQDVIVGADIVGGEKKLNVK